MKRLSLTFISLCLLFGQFNADGAKFFRAADPYLPPPAESSLTVRANIYFGDEDEETDPVVAADFYLLDESLIKILKTAKFKPVFTDGKKHRISDEDYLEAAAQALAFQGDEKNDKDAETVKFLIDEAMAKHRQFVAKTNSFGRAYFKNLQTGNYFLFGIGKTEEQVVVWHLPVEIKPAKNSIEFDQNNAAVIFSATE